MALLAFSGGNAIGRIQLSNASEQNAKAPTAESLQEILADQGSRELFEDLCDRYLIASGISGVQPKVMIKTDDDGQDSSDGDGHGDNDSQALADRARPPAKVSIGARSTLRAKNLIVKVGGVDYPGLAENEFHCLCIAKRANLPVPAFWLSEDGKRFAIERFDVERKTKVFPVLKTWYLCRVRPTSGNTKPPMKASPLSSKKIVRPITSLPRPMTCSHRLY